MAFSFGAPSAPNNNTFGSFGSTAPTTTSAFGAPSTGFGSTSTAFGTNTNTTTTTAFGAPATNTFGTPTTNTFGTPATNTFGTPAANTFGAPATNTFGTPATSNTFTFGGASTSTAPSTGFNFGNTTTSTAPTSTGFSFGNTSTAPSTGFSFGNTSTAPSTGFSFGNTSTAPSTGFSFGNTSTAPSTGFSFGNTSTAPSTGFSFGSTKPGLNTTPSLFGAQGSGFGGTTNFQQQQQQQQQQQRNQQIWNLLCQVDEEEKKAAQSEAYKPDSVWHSLALLKSWWDPQSPHCKFKHYFYNVVPPQEVGLYQKPENQDTLAWTLAQSNNPDPTTMVPALAVGFDDVQKRINMQHKLSEAHMSKLNEIANLIKKLQQKDKEETASKLEEYKRKHMETTQRVLALLKYTQVLRNKGLSITPDEEAMCARFENVKDQLQRSGQFHGKLSQLWAQLQLIKESGRKYGKIDSIDEWESVSQQNMSGITKILEEQNTGIQHIIEVLNKDASDIETVQKERFIQQYERQ